MNLYKAFSNVPFLCLTRSLTNNFTTLKKSDSDFTHSFDLVFLSFLLSSFISEIRSVFISSSKASALVEFEFSEGTSSIASISCFTKSLISSKTTCESNSNPGDNSLKYGFLSWSILRARDSYSWVRFFVYYVE
uniref:Uncharacterized protein n=1 Tax=Wolfiporia cocos TaxID=81056 RepID=A0A7G7YDZ7_9APHY|nr:hypothetical protein [Wolfiporia cocos]